MACSSARERSAASASSFFFILFSNAAVNLNLDLSKLHLAPQNLILLLLQGCFCFFKSRLQFHLFSLKALSNFVNFMDGSSSFSNLIHDILDFIGESFVLS